MTVIAHLSDTHLDTTARAADRTTRVLRYLAGLTGRIDAFLVTGDIADHGEPVEYEETRHLLDKFDLPGPVLLLPGNHDVREPFRTVLLGQPAGAGDPSGPINSAHRVGDATFALCDSTIPGRPDGILADETITWLDATLATAGPGPAFVCMHHHPVPVGQSYVDDIRLFGAERLEEVVRRHRVAAILCGHAHTPAADTFAGVPVRVAPGVVSTVRLQWEPGHVIDVDAPPGVAFHHLREDGSLMTNFRVVP